MHYGKEQGRTTGDNFVIYDVWSHYEKFILSYLVGIPSVINKASNKYCIIICYYINVRIFNYHDFAILKNNLGIWNIMN